MDDERNDAALTSARDGTGDAIICADA